MAPGPPKRPFAGREVPSGAPEFCVTVSKSWIAMHERVTQAEILHWLSPPPPNPLPPSRFQ